MSRTPDYHRRAVDYFDSQIHLVRADQWGDPTPCTEWDVRTLVNHIVYEDMWTPELFAGKTIEEVGDRFDGDLLGDDPLGVWDRASKEAVSAVQDDGAMDRLVNVSWGQITGEVYAQQLFLDHLIHGWDLATAIGGDTRLDEELVEVCWADAKDQEELIRASGAFGEAPEVAEGASTQTKLLALLGRRG